ncbi:MAG: hypothetical protein MJZ90_04075 [Bacteroidales bacterium]|nr:hypothetical protein [Bacteroidales bacterium]
MFSDKKRVVYPSASFQMSYGPSGTYGPSLHSRMTVPLSSDSRRCHCPIATTMPMQFEPTRISKESTSLPLSSRTY